MAKDTKPVDLSEKKRKIIAAVTVAVFALFIALLTVFAARQIDELSKDPLVFRSWIQAFGFWGKLVFVSLAAIQVILALIPGGPVQIAAGYAFGIIEGSVLCTVGIQIGSAIAFLLARYLGTKVIYLFFSREKVESVRFLQGSKRLEFLTFICFLIPGAPKDLLTYFCGITKIPFWKFILITTIARIPSIIISVMSGNALVEQKYILAIIIIAVLCLFSLIGFLTYKKIISNPNGIKKQ